MKFFPCLSGWVLRKCVLDHVILILHFEVICILLLVILYHVHTQDKRKQWSLCQPNHKKVWSSWFLSLFWKGGRQKARILLVRLFYALGFFCLFVCLFFRCKCFNSVTYNSKLNQNNWLSLQNSEHLWIAINFKVIYECSEAPKIRPIISSFYIWIKLIKHFSFSGKFLYWTVQFKLSYFSRAYANSGGKWICFPWEN